MITDIEAFYSKALKYTVTRGMLEQLEVYYESGTIDKNHLELNLEKKSWEVIQKKNLEEVHQEKTIGEKVKGLFSWFGNSPSTKKQEVVVPPPITVARPRNMTFH